MRSAATHALKRMLAGLFFGMLLMLSAPAMAADCTAPAVTLPPTAMTELVVSKVRAPVVAAACKMLETNYTIFQPIIAACCLLAIILTGYKVVTGQMRRPQAEISIMVLKIAAVAYFSQNLADWYPDIIAAMDDLVKIVIAPLADDVLTCTGVEPDNLWGRIDCIFAYMMGISAGGMLGGVLGMVMLEGLASGAGFMQGADLGVTFFQIGIGMFLMTFVALARSVYGFVAAGIMIAFLIALAPIVLPCILFRATADYFKKWVGLLLSYILQPFVIFGFLAVTMTYVDVAVFTGDYSIANTVFGRPVTSFEDFSNQMKQFYTTAHLEEETLLGTTVLNAGKMPNVAVQPADGNNSPAFGFIQRMTRSDELTAEAEKMKGMVGGQADFASLGFTSDGLEQVMKIELVIQILGLGMLFYILASLAETVPELARELVGSYGHSAIGAMPMPSDTAGKYLSERSMDLIKTGNFGK